ncbi:hypothetical protein [Micromonospora wenchangensis]|uniref:hypothetical protein n=1 Tax=Micromonospora wenchangensis TaxID=1185415 RepID=UPI0034391339
MKSHRWVLPVTGLLVIVLGVVFLALGLSRADQLASTIGAITGVIGLGLTVVTWLGQRQASPQTVSATRPDRPPNIVINDGKGFQIGDHNTQNNEY